MIINKDTPIDNATEDVRAIVQIIFYASLFCVRLKFVLKFFYCVRMQLC